MTTPINSVRPAWLLLACSLILHRSAAGESEIRPGEKMFDSDGHIIQAHQPYLFHYNGTVYWYGSEKVGSSDGTAGIINVYTSKDLMHWESHGEALNCNTEEHRCYVARPSMLHHPTTGKFIMWAKGGESFSVAIADHPLGPFKMLGTYLPTNDSSSGDSQTFADPVNTGKAYMVYSQKPKVGPSGTLYERELKIHRLTDDWTKIEDGGEVATLKGHLEAPAPFYSKVANRYYVWSSHTSGWNPNPAVMHEAKSMEGPWEDVGNPSGSKTTFGTQGSSVRPLDLYSNGGAQRAVYVGDRYEPYVETVEGSRYIFLPMEIAPSGKVTLFNCSSWSLDHWPSDAKAVYASTVAVEEEKEESVILV